MLPPFFAIISAILFSLSFSKPSIWPFAFIALVPFFYILDKAKNNRQRFLYGAIWAVVMAGAMGNWLFIALCEHYGLGWGKAGLFFLVCLVLPLVLMYGVFGLAYGFFRQDRFLFYAVVIPSLWTVTESLKALIPGLIPWGNIGYAVMPFADFIQVADVTGIYGLTWIMAGINALIMLLIKDFWGDKKVRYRMVGVFFLLIFVFSVLIGYGRFRTADIRALAEHGKQVNATLVQGNFSLEDRWSGMGFYRRVQTYLSMSREKDDSQNPRIIVWPETTLNASARLDEAFFKSLMQAIGKDALLISGGLKPSPDGGVYNSAYLVSGKGRLQRYDKHILLPYAETVPLIDWLGEFYTAPDEFVKGGSPLCFDTFLGKTAPSICFETLYPAYIRQSVKSGAEVLVNISNDAWFGDSAMPHMHLDAARMRAIEHRRYVLRTSNSGISAIIDPNGRVAERSRLFEQARVSGTCRLSDQTTIYTKYGNWVLYAAAAVLLLACIGQVFDRER
ncbi:MAG: apolipoprotein N-acyltransferase [Desulfobacterales bacterium]|nr:apolipoprotein N-acyltransferase [Desulfobacterales bacterium]